MEHLPFALFQVPINNKFTSLISSSDVVLAKADIDTDVLWETYQSAFPKEVNGIFRERRHYDGNYDKNYVHNVGKILAVYPDGHVDTIWNTNVEGYFQDVARAMHSLVVGSPLKTIYSSKVKVAGSLDTKDNSSNIVWTHFHSVIPDHLLHIGDDKIGAFNTNLDVAIRTLASFSLSSVDTVLELISSNSIYRGAEFKAFVEKFRNELSSYLDVSEELKTGWVFHKVAKGCISSGFKNSVIGTLVSDIEDGVEINKAVASYESKVAPTNYKRSSAVVTPSMIENAKRALMNAGFLESIDRRFAHPSEIPVSNMLFCANQEKALNPFDSLAQDAKRRVNKNSLKAIDKAVECGIDKFISDILPSASAVEVLYEGRHSPQKVALLNAMNPNSAKMFKWDNHFSWSYQGGTTDVIKERVKEEGGQIDCDFRVSVMWHNSDDIDLELAEPPGSGHRCPISYHNHKGSCSSYGGMLDLDMNGIDKHSGTAPVENIYYKNLKRMVNGVYKVNVNQFSKRANVRNGFLLQVEMLGEIRTWKYEKDLRTRIDDILCIGFKDGSFSIESAHPDLVEVTSPAQQEFIPVSAIMRSPNAWGDNPVGNLHTFFILEGERFEKPTRGFYNEYLNNELNAHRKVLEVLAEKTQAVPQDGVDQVVGLGFSSTVRNKLTVRVTGKTQQICNISF